MGKWRSFWTSKETAGTCWARPLLGSDTGNMDRAIVAYRQDDDGHWVAELACGHTQHVRHEPPWQLRPWVLTEEGRRSFVGTYLNCRLCDTSERPHGEP
ncbi:MAG TPA: DUF3565 domain-containing protein [Gemmatimonadaceae bacterium]|nr:DUF3565 domain-containing protein [Gemmatimonadaceae bacterium]